MSTEQTKEILQRGIAAAKSGDAGAARPLLQSVIRAEPGNESAWLWLSSVAENDKERIFCLRKLLEINPNNENARKGLERLGVSVDAPKNPPTPTPPRQTGQLNTPTAGTGGKTGQLPTPPTPGGKTGQLTPIPTTGGKTGQLNPPAEPAPPPDKAGQLSTSSTVQIRRLPGRAPTSQNPVVPSTTGQTNADQIESVPGGSVAPAASPSSSGRLPTPPASSGSIPVPTGPQPPVPFVNDQKLTAALPQLDALLRDYQPVPLQTLPFEWKKKTGRRAGEGSANSLRLRIAGGVIAALVVIVVVVIVVGRSTRGGLFAAFAPPPPTVPPTVTLTPSPTLTPMFGITSTPTPTSASVVVPSPLPQLTPGIGLGYRTSTPAYPVIIDSPVRDAMAKLYSGRTQDAINDLAKVIEQTQAIRDDRYYNTLFYYTKALIQGNQADVALDLLQKDQTKRASESEKYYHAALALAQYAKGNKDAAQTEADQARAADPKLIDAVIIAARVRADRGTSRDLNDAERLLETALSSQPSNALLLNELAQAQFKNGKLEDALKTVLNALYVDPLDYDAYVLRGDILLQKAATQPEGPKRLQAYGDAAIAALEFRALYQDRTIVHYQLGRAYQGEGKTEQALYSYEQATVVDKTSMEAQRVFLTRGQLYLDQRNYNAARLDFENANRIAESEQGLRGRLTTALVLGDFSAALDAVDSLLKLNASDSALGLSQYDLLLRAYVQALANPDIPRSKDVISRFRNLGNTIDTTLLNTLSDDAKTTVRLFRGVWYFDKGSTDKALDDLRFALARRDSVIGYYFRAKTYQALNQNQNAVRDYEWVTFWSQISGFELSSDAQKQLDDLRAKLPKLTATLSPTNTPTPRVSPTPTATRTPSPTRTPTNTRTPSVSATPLEPSATPTLEGTPTETRTPTLTPTPTGDSGEETPTPSPTSTRVASDG